MKNILFLLAIFFSVQFADAQVTYSEFNSKTLGQTREVKIQLPLTYESSKKSYPVIFVLDGDYMFEIVAGNISFSNYWEDIPEAIVVGVNQFQDREADNKFSKKNFLPVQSGAAFFEFIGKELVPYIDRTYRTEKFKVAVGHGASANFINYYLLKEVPLFNAYISLSPELAPDMPNFLAERLPKIESETFYYLATSNNDVIKIKEETEALGKAVNAIENPNILSTFEMFDGPTHYSLPAFAIPKALESIFMVYRPISKKEYKDVLSKLQTSPVDYLKDKYKKIEKLFGLKKTILVNDFKAVSAAIKKTEQFDEYEALGRLARKEYPNTLLGNYYLGRYFEGIGKQRKAMKAYQSGYILDGIGGITKEQVIQIADRIKEEYGL